MICLQNYIKQTKMKRTLLGYSLILLNVAVFSLFSGCTKHDRSDEAVALSEEIVEEGFSDIAHAMQRVDSAQQAGLFTAVRANTVKAMMHENVDKLQLAAYYAEKAIAAEEAVKTPADSTLYCVARWILSDVTFTNGEYGKSLSLTKEILTFIGEGDSPEDVIMRCRALTTIAECESELNHIDESERLFLQCVDMLMESTVSATDYSDIDPLIYALLSLNDLYIDNHMPEKAIPLLPKLDTTVNRLARACDDEEWILLKRRNNATISKAMVYAANGQYNQAQALLRVHQQSQGLDASDKTAAGVCLTMMSRYDEAVRLFDEADTMMRANGELVTDIYVKTLLKHKYDALQRAGHMSEAMRVGDDMLQLTDSLQRQERLTNVEQMQQILRQEEEIAQKRQSISTQRIILMAAFLLLLLSGYIIWRVRRDNRLLTEKNRRLFEQIEQREQAKQEQQRYWQAQPEQSLTPEQQLYRRLCTLMTEQQPYTDEHLNRDSLARLLNTNAKYVEQAIRECSHGETVMDFITRYRLEHVAHLLKTTGDPIALIGEQSGIPSRATLARLFRNTYGMSCSEYRQIAGQK